MTGRRASRINISKEQTSNCMSPGTNLHVGFGRHSLRCQTRWTKRYAQRRRKGQSHSQYFHHGAYCGRRIVQSAVAEAGSEAEKTCVNCAAWTLPKTRCRQTGWPPLQLKPHVVALDCPLLGGGHDEGRPSSGAQPTHILPPDQHTQYMSQYEDESCRSRPATKTAQLMIRSWLNSTQPQGLPDVHLVLHWSMDGSINDWINWTVSQHSTEGVLKMITCTPANPYCSLGGSRCCSCKACCCSAAGCAIGGCGNASGITSAAMSPPTPAAAAAAAACATPRSSMFSMMACRSTCHCEAMSRWISLWH
jgi:hypothetical protein